MKEKEKEKEREREKALVHIQRERRERESLKKPQNRQKSNEEFVDEMEEDVRQIETGRD